MAADVYRPASKEEETVGALEVLLGARELLLRSRWIQGAPSVSGGYSIYGAIQHVGRDAPLRAEWARKALRSLVGLSIPSWNDEPLRTRGDVLHVLGRAIDMLEGRSSRVPIPIYRRRGGWSVGGVQ